MRLLSRETEGRVRGAVAAEGRAVDLEAAVRHAGLPGSARSVRAFLEHGYDLAAVEQAARELALRGSGTELRRVRLLPPVPRPDKILCIGLNYRDHAEEAGLPLPTTPMAFAKFPNSLIGPDDEIVLPDETEPVDYEAELAVVIGRRGKGIREKDALSYVAGVMVFNDVSARNMQQATSQWTLGKALDTFGPCGPHLVTLDEIPDLTDIRLRTRVNGEVVQDGTTADMIFSVPELVAYLSRTMTLEPGDIIATGTPAGVGFKRTPPVLLTEGSLVEVEIDSIGRLSNRVVAPVSASATPSPVAVAER